MGQHQRSGAYLAVAYLAPFVDHAAAPCRDTSALHWGACCGAAGVGGQTKEFGEVSVEGPEHYVESAGLCTLQPLRVQLVLR